MHIRNQWSVLGIRRKSNKTSASVKPLEHFKQSVNSTVILYADICNMLTFVLFMDIASKEVLFFLTRTLLRIANKYLISGERRNLFQY